jgi:PAS domain S-box-containing protein
MVRQPESGIEENKMIMPEQLLGLLNNLEEALVLVDNTGTILFCNTFPRSFHHLVPRPLQPGNSIYDIVPSQWKIMSKGLFNKVVITRTPSTIDVQSTDPQGGKLFFEIACKPIINEGQPLQVLIEGKDVTPQKIFEKKTSAIGSELSNLIQNANAVIIVTDSRGYIIDWNEMSTSVTGYTKMDALTKQFSDLLLDADQQKVFATVMQNVLEGKPLINLELPVHAKDNRKLTFLINANPKMNSTGHVVGVLFVGQDITELIEYRISLETRVEERTRELNELNYKLQEQKSIVEAERKKSENLLLNILPDSIAQELKERGHVAPRHYPMTSILFADLVGFTVLSKGLSPDMLLQELNYISVGFDLIVEKNNLEKIKTIGDGYMAVGGVPVEDVENPENAVRTGLEMIEFVKRINKDNQTSSRPPWRIRVGIHTGELIAGVIGKNKFAYDVWGASVNTASRMELAGEADKVNISEATYQLVKHKFHCAYRGNIAVKNMGKMNMYFIE